MGRRNPHRQTGRCQPRLWRLAAAAVADARCGPAGTGLIFPQRKGLAGRWRKSSASQCLHDGISACLGHSLRWRSFLYISLLAIVSLVALLLLKARLSAFALNRFIRLGALIALPLSFVSMEMGDNNWGVAVVAIVWAVLVAIISKNEVNQRQIAKK